MIYEFVYQTYMMYGPSWKENNTFGNCG